MQSNYMNFIEETNEFGHKSFNLQVELKIPCSEEEKRIYGVDSKFPERIWLPSIFQAKFYDGGIFYYAREHYYLNSDFPLPVPFSNLDKAKEYLIEQAKKAKLKFL